MPKSSGAEPQALPPLALRIALRAYPKADRAGYGEELLEAALELADHGSSPLREAVGLLRGGGEARLVRTRLGLGAVGLRAGLRQLALPLAAFVTMIWSAAAGARIVGVGPSAEPAMTVGAVLLFVILAFLVLGVARGQRGIAAASALALAVYVAAGALWYTARGGVVTASPSLHLAVGSWSFGPNITWTLLPILMLLVPASLCMRPAAPRVPGIPRPLTESMPVRVLLLISPALALCGVLEAAPGLLIEEGGLETTDLPGLTYLMGIVALWWVATAVPQGDECRAVGCALVLLCATPSLAFSTARVVISPLEPLISNRDLWVAFGLVVAIVLVLAALAVFTVVLARIGLRVIDRRGGSPLAVGHAIPLGPEDSRAD